MKNGARKPFSADDLDLRPRVVGDASAVSPEVGRALQEQQNHHVDFAAVRESLAEKKGPRFWRSLHELSNSEEFAAAVKTEFPQMAAEWDQLDRRSFMKLMGASMALMGLTACTKQPEELIVPYVTPPEELVPGRPMYYATMMSLGGYALGLLAESHMGRPTKLEGNPEHPASLGGTGALAQASILNLYDPDRSSTVLRRGRVSSWDRFSGALAGLMAEAELVQGDGLRLLTGTVTSPTLARQIRALLEKYPKAIWHQYEPVSRDAVRAGSELAFGKVVDTLYHFDKADVVLSLDSDFLYFGPGRVRYAHDFASRRMVDDEHPSINRMYAVESTFSVTGSNADHRLPVRASDVMTVARVLARELGVAGFSKDKSSVSEADTAFVDALVDDLKHHKGTSVVVPGAQQPAELHALAHAINAKLGNVGKTVTYVETVEAEPVQQMESLKTLVADMGAGKVDTLVIVGGNPAYDAPGDLSFADAMEGVTTRIHLSMYEDETSRICHWHVPQSHELEAWGDGRAFDGTASICQPLIEPLYGTKSAVELLSTMLGTAPNGLDAVRETWAEHEGGSDDKAWRRTLHDGVVPGTAAAEVKVRRAKVKVEDTEAASHDVTSEDGALWSGLEVVVRPDASVFDGSFANNGWMQEAPHPVHRTSWGNVVEVSPADAKRLSLNNEDLVDIAVDGRSVVGPVWIAPGQAQGSVTVTMGYGRRYAGRIGDGVGFDVRPLRSSSAPYIAASAELIKTGRKKPIANTQKHSNMENRHLVRSTTVDHFAEHPDFAHHLVHEFPESATMYKPPFDYSKGNQWGMAINLNACIGCNACLVACQSENNIAVVGEKEVRNGREMHWIRVDRYYEGDPDNPTAVHQPVPCMQCENAPCETVCPVGATVHSHDGLNQMVYNRCVGTRYCSNNCPYKVRKFNFFQYQDRDTESLKLRRNPNVTVRVRGVMEKCTYCVQRISAARIEAKKEGRLVEEGEVQSACQQACPTKAISFGDINNPDSEVAKKKASPLNYGILTELATRPRTTYLARVTNPNPALVDASDEHHGGGHGGGHGAPHGDEHGGDAHH